MMKKKILLTNFILFWLIYFALLLIYPVHATEEVDLTDFPKQLSKRLNIPLFAAQLLTSGLFLALFLFPTLLLTKNVLAHLMIGLIIMGFCVAMGWLHYWFILVTMVVVALMFSGKVRDWISGKG